MLSRVRTAAITGIRASEISVETDISRGLPAFTVVGLADTTVKEARERVRSSIIYSGFSYPACRITMNMAPAGVRKRGSLFDLPMAVGILAASGQVPVDRLGEYIMAGELSLGGQVRGVSGILAISLMAKEEGIKQIIVPYENRLEAALIPELKVYPVKSLKELADFFRGIEAIQPVSEIERNKAIDGVRQAYSRFEVLDFADVRGQEAAKRAALISAAGGHGLLMTGSPSSGKTMIAERMPGILPKMTWDEVILATVIYSTSGRLDAETPIIMRRPFRSPHHSIGVSGLVGGGWRPDPGEITLACGGILFLDEAAEFKREVLEALRTPLEKKKITIKRHGDNFEFPAEFISVIATNPCPCGYFCDPEIPCTCSASSIRRYKNRLSGPLLDRIDLHISMVPSRFEDIRAPKTDSTIKMREMVEFARKAQDLRFRDSETQLNSEMDGDEVEKFAALDSKTESFLEDAANRLCLSPRSIEKTVKVARTIADLEGAKDIRQEDLAEALIYRRKI